MVSTRNPLANRKNYTLEEVAAAAADFSADRIYAAGARQAFSALPLAPARHHGTAEYRHDQTLRGADAGVSFISESFAKDQVKAGEVKLSMWKAWICGGNSD